jgi:hypothetical protein
MKQGAYVDESEFIQPWVNLFMEFFNDNLDKEEAEGSFQPLNIGIGWIINENQEGNQETRSCT